MNHLQCHSLLGEVVEFGGDAVPEPGMGNPHPVKPETLTVEVFPGVTYERLHDNRSIIYTVESARAAAFSAWSDTTLEILEAWPKDKPYLAVHDISHPGLGLLYCTAVQDDIFNICVLPQARERIEAMFDAYPDWKIALAVVVSSSLSGRLARLLFREDLPEARVQTKAFFYRDPAMNWLANFYDSQ